MREALKNILVLSALTGVFWAGLTAAAEEATQRHRPSPEQRAQRQEQMKERWNKLDTNHDGKISRDEAKLGAPKMAEHFGQLDTNSDGQLTPDEMRQAHQARQTQRKERRLGQPAAESKSGT